MGAKRLCYSCEIAGCRFPAADADAADADADADKGMGMCIDVDQTLRRPLLLYWQCAKL